jgi:hypothetical protein
MSDWIDQHLDAELEHANKRARAVRQHSPLAVSAGYQDGKLRIELEHRYGNQILAIDGPGAGTRYARTTDRCRYRPRRALAYTGRSSTPICTFPP